MCVHSSISHTHTPTRRLLHGWRSCLSLCCGWRLAVFFLHAETHPFPHTYTQVASLLSLARTLFLVLLLAAGSYYLHADTHALVLRPVERMVERVREMAEDPLMQVCVQ